MLFCSDCGHEDDPSINVPQKLETRTAQSRQGHDKCRSSFTKASELFLKVRRPTAELRYQRYISITRMYNLICGFQRLAACYEELQMRLDARALQKRAEKSCKPFKIAGCRAQV
jgi:hypothetical protein